MNRQSQSNNRHTARYHQPTALRHRTDQPLINQPELCLHIAQSGTYYCPAQKHYDQSRSETTQSVYCDRCHAHDLPACIGYGNNLDLCLLCVSTILDDHHRKLTHSHDRINEQRQLISPTMEQITAHHSMFQNDLYLHNNTASD